MSGHLIICIGRQFGSGGREIGQKLSEKLGIAFYDKEILRKAAQEQGISPAAFEQADEKPRSLLYSLSAGAYGSLVTPTNYDSPLTNDQLFRYQSTTIKKLADEGSCIIIGRCADSILEGRDDMFSVFIHAPLSARIERICRVRGVSEDVARDLIKKTDRSRANYYNYYAERDWGAVDSYDFALNSAVLGVDGSVDALADLAARFGK